MGLWACSTVPSSNWKNRPTVRLWVFYYFINIKTHRLEWIYYWAFPPSLDRQFPLSFYNNMYTAISNNKVLACRRVRCVCVWMGDVGLTFYKWIPAFTRVGGVKLDIVSKAAELWGFQGREWRQFDPEVDSRCKWTFDLFLNLLWFTG